MKSLIIGFSRAKSLLEIGSIIIAAADKEPYSHCYIRINDASTGLDMIYQASKGYVNCLTYNNFCTANLPVKEYQMAISDSMYINTLTLLQNNLGVKYGFMQLVAMGIKLVFGVKINFKFTDNEYICSQFAGVIAKYEGIKMPDDLKFQAPSDIDRLLAASNVSRVL